jgi:acyl transferase domain-containing protein
MPPSPPAGRFYLVEAHAEENVAAAEAGELVEINGAQGRNRTTDTVIFSHVLYQLSYLGPVPDGRRLMAEMLRPVQPTDAIPRAPRAACPRAIPRSERGSRP